MTAPSVTELHSMKPNDSQLFFNRALLSIGVVFLYGWDILRPIERHKTLAAATLRGSNPPIFEPTRFWPVQGQHKRRLHVQPVSPSTWQFQEKEIRGE